VSRVARSVACNCRRVCRLCWSRLARSRACRFCRVVAACSSRCARRAARTAGLARAAYRTKAHTRHRAPQRACERGACTDRPRTAGAASLHRWARGPTSRNGISPDNQRSWYPPATCGRAECHTMATSAGASPRAIRARAPSVLWAVVQRVDSLKMMHKTCSFIRDFVECLLSNYDPMCSRSQVPVRPPAFSPWS
jgi:hypothetical protein